MLLINALLAFTILGGAAPQLKVATTARAASAIPAPAPASAPACQSTAHTGTFRVTTVTRDSSSSRVGMILLENVDGCLEASMLTDQSGPALIDHLAVSGDVITGSIHMTHGLGRVSLRVSDAGIAGSIFDGRNEWSVVGKRTN